MTRSESLKKLAAYFEGLAIGVSMGVVIGHSGSREVMLAVLVIAVCILLGAYGLEVKARND